MAPIDVAEAESSPAITLDSLTPSERLTWRETGNFPDRSDAAAASSPASPESPAASTDASVAPASEPGPSAKKGAESRKAELAAEIQELLRQRADLKRDLSTPPAPVRDVPPAVSSTATGTSEKPTWAQFESQIGAKYSSWAEAQDGFADARDVWKDAELSRKRDAAAQREHVDTVLKTADEQIREFQQRDPAFWEKVSPEIGSLQALSVARLHDPSIVRTPQHDIAEVIVTSPHAAQWMLHLSSHPEVFRALSQARGPEQVYREMGRIEATFTPLVSGADSAPVTQPVSMAPPPPPTLGSKPTDPMSEVEQAMRTGDFRAYRAAKNREEMAQKR